MVQQEEHVLCKHNGLSLSPQHPGEMQAWLCVLKAPASVGGDRWILGACEPKQ